MTGLFLCEFQIFDAENYHSAGLSKKTVYQKQGGQIQVLVLVVAGCLDDALNEPIVFLFNIGKSLDDGIIL